MIFEKGYVTSIEAYYLLPVLGTYHDSSTICHLPTLVSSHVQLLTIDYQTNQCANLQQ